MSKQFWRDKLNQYQIDPSTMIIDPPSEVEKIKSIIHHCMTLDIIIPAEFIDMYNRMAKEGSD